MKSFVLLIFVNIHAFFNLAQSFGTDSQVFPLPVTDNAKVMKVAPGLNGGLYGVIYSEPIVAGTPSEMYFIESLDNGLNWTNLGWLQVNADETLVDIEIATSGASNQSSILHSAFVIFNYSTNLYIVRYFQFDFNTNLFLPTNFPYFDDPSPIRSIALANDFDFPASGAAPYSVNVTYVKSTAVQDSIISLVSMNGGVDFPTRNTVINTTYYVKNVSLDYGRSPNAGNGRYFCAWDMFFNSTDENGLIFTSKTNFSADDVWTAPKRIDNLSGATNSLSRNPKIAVQRSNQDNDSSALTATIVFETDYDGGSTDYEIYSASNSVAHFTDHWFIRPVQTTGDNDIQPDLAFDKANNRFVSVNYNATGKHIVTMQLGINLSGSSIWSFYGTNFVNDVVERCIDPKPEVFFIPQSNKIGVAWIDDFPGQKIGMYDSAIELSDLQENRDEISVEVFPNPVNEHVTIRFEETFAGEIQLLSVDGRVISSLQVKGSDEVLLDLRELSEGSYLLHGTSTEAIFTKNIIKR